MQMLHPNQTFNSKNPISHTKMGVPTLPGLTLDIAIENLDIAIESSTLCEDQSVHFLHPPPKKKHIKYLLTAASHEIHRSTLPEIAEKK